MELWLQTLLLVIGMTSVCSFLYFFKNWGAKSNLMFLFGTGALLGICIFDLIPDVFELGGRRGLAVALAVGLFYSLVHLFHLRHHQKETVEDHDHHHHHSGSFSIFFISLVSHCFASGILLFISQSFSQRLAGAVFLALIAHKGYECAIFMSILLQQNFRRVKTFIAIAVYCLALPTGVILSWTLQDKVSQAIAIYVSSIAVGSLLGCLIFDFLVPSFHHLKRRRYQVGWLLLGLVLTRIIMGAL